MVPVGQKTIDELFLTDFIDGFTQNRQLSTGEYYDD